MIGHKEVTKSHCFFFQIQLRYRWYHVNVSEEGDTHLTMQQFGCMNTKTTFGGV